MGARAFASGLLLEVRPLPMAAALLCALLGVGWAQGDLRKLPAATPFLLACVFCGLYTAHLMDTYVDVVKRGDRTPADFPLLFRDSTGLIANRAYPPLIALSAALTLALAAVPATDGGLPVLLPLLAGLGVALTYAPFLDRRTLGVTLGYPTGVACVLAAGYALASGGLDLGWLALASALFLALAGTKARSDIIDFEQDRRIAKRTVPVLIGPRRALALGYGAALAGLLLAAALPFFFGVTPWFALPALAMAGAVLASARLDPFAGSMAMAGSLFALLAAEVAVLALVG